jgi:predicted GIY-YIG superfamily endonuclease
MIYIYKLTDGEKDYYGQTENWERRFGEHKTPKCRCLSRLLDKSKMKIHIIHRLYTQEEADETEAFYQLNFECVNNSVTGRTQKEYSKKYRKDNKESLAEKQKKIYKNNKEKIRERQNKYYELNKEKLLEKFDCNCGGIYSTTNKQRHLKSKKHQNFINQK